MLYIYMLNLIYVSMCKELFVISEGYFNILRIILTYVPRTLLMNLNDVSCQI